MGVLHALSLAMSEPVRPVGEPVRWVGVWANDMRRQPRSQEGTRANEWLSTNSKVPLSDLMRLSGQRMEPGSSWRNGPAGLVFVVKFLFRLQRSGTGPARPGTPGMGLAPHTKTPGQTRPDQTRKVTWREGKGGPAAHSLTHAPRHNRSG